MSDTSYLEKIFEIVELSRFKEAQLNSDLFTGVTDEEKQLAYKWHSGRELLSVVNSSGYAIIIEKLRKYMEEDAIVLFSTEPTGNKDEVAARHAVAYASANIFKRLNAEIQSDIEASRTVPNIVKEGYQITKGVPAGPE
jgi:hypothetical protein